MREVDRCVSSARLRGLTSVRRRAEHRLIVRAALRHRIRLEFRDPIAVVHWNENGIERSDFDLHLILVIGGRIVWRWGSWQTGNSISCKPMLVRVIVAHAMAVGVSRPIPRAPV